MSGPTGAGLGTLRVIDPGLAATVQDNGRFGWLRDGVPQAGALDAEALRLANALVGAAAGAAALEVRFLGPVLQCESAPVRVALVGADVAMSLERGPGGETDAAVETVGPWRTATLRPGDRLRVGPLKGAVGAVLAIAGGVDAPSVLGSRATFLRGGFGGVDGRALRAGDLLPIAPGSAPPTAAERWIAPENRPSTPTPVAAAPGGPAWRVRVVPGPQDDFFSEVERARFFNDPWTISQNADRMGLRLEGAPLVHDPAKGFNIISDGIAAGSIQVPGAGVPIVLLADRGTAGGYPKIATVATVDLPLLGRLGPGARLWFRPTTPAEALAALRAREAALAAAVAAVAPYHEPGAVDEARLRDSNLITASVDPDPDVDTARG